MFSIHGGGSNPPPHRCNLLDACGPPFLVRRIFTIGRRHHPATEILCGSSLTRGIPAYCGRSTSRLVESTAVC